MKHCLSIAFALCAASSWSQITITQADMPNANDSILVTHAAAGATDPAMTGTSYVWDFSDLDPQIQRYEKFDPPSAFGPPFSFIFNPFNTSYGRDNYQYTSYPVPGFTIEDAYDFFKENTTDLRQIGIGFRINGTPAPIQYSQPDIIFNFPLDYNDIDSCDYEYGTPIPGMGYYGQWGHRVTVADGWGQVITPLGTFTALRVKSTVAATDTVYSDDFGWGGTFDRPLLVQYKWLVNGGKVPVLQFTGNMTGSGYQVTDIFYADTLRPDLPQVGITEYSGSTIHVYPNPSSGDFSVSIANGTSEQFELYDGRGRMVLRSQVSSTTVIRTAGLPRGIYLYRCGAVTGRIVLQ